ncbi:MAG: SDR family oxidoreductase [Bacillota bacterium]|nr:SDR family oxidoreductase [Bacillota bacterium]
MFDLTGKKALVTGSTQGIGFAIALCLAQRGAKVFVNGASSMEKCKAASDKIPGSIPVKVDLSHEGCADEIYAQTGDIDILVLNASVQYRKAWDEITSDEFDTQIQVNLKSSLELMQKYVPNMKKQGWGRIVTVGSVQQYKPHTHMAVYAASKCAQMSLVNNLAAQLAQFGITVNNMSPGVIATPRNDAALADEEYSKVIYSKIPAGYAGTAEDCAGGVLLLCSEEGRYITGSDLIIDGGMHL